MPMVKGAKKDVQHERLLTVRSYLISAQELMDEIDPASIFGARLQHLIDELEERVTSVQEQASEIH